MLTFEELEEIFGRYHVPEWDGFNREQAVLDIGRLVGHAKVLARKVTAHQAALDGLMGRWREERDARLAAERERASLALRLPMVIAAGDALAEALVASNSGEAELGLWRTMRGASGQGRA